MKKQNYIIALALILILGFAIFNKSKTQSDVTAYSTQQPLPKKESGRDISSVRKSEPITESIALESSAQISETEVKDLNSKLPFKKVIQEEIKANPHAPPISLMTFAEKLGPMMEKAFKSEVAAKTMMGVLSDCANNDSLANSARALCVSDTEKISKFHPKMQNQANDLRASMSPEIQKMLDTNDSMIKR